VDALLFHRQEKLDTKKLKKVGSESAMLYLLKWKGLEVEKRGAKCGKNYRDTTKGLG
jgi:hypothetical protein